MSAAAAHGVRALYVCYFGVDEPLVQTQVLPYLRELVGGGVAMSLLTFEPDCRKRWTADAIAARKRQLRRDGIDWHLLPYHKRPSLLATMWDIALGAWTVAALARRDRIDILHGRSHVGAAIGMLAKRLTGAQVVFDIRGFLAEEYVDTGRWKAGGFVFRLVKAAERWLCRSADGFVVLADRARETLFPCGPPRGQPLEVVPCCVDPRTAAAPRPDRDAIRARLGVSERLVFIHAGTVGGAYLSHETAVFLAAAREMDPRVFALVLTQGSAVSLVRELEALGFSRVDYCVARATPDEVPQYMHAADVGILLRRSSPAAPSASPARFAEYLAAGLPVVATAGIGDLDAHIQAGRVGVLLRAFDREAYVAALVALQEIRSDPELGARCRELSRTMYNLQTIGGPRYRRLYDAVLTRAARRGIRVLALASYPLQAASTRYRVAQFIGPLAERGIDVHLAPFLSPPLFASLYEPRRFLTRLPRVGVQVLRQIGAAFRARQADLVFVQREAMLFGPPLIEWIATRLLRRPLILDLDDATYMSYTSPVYGRLSTLLKWPSKTVTLIRWSRVVICGNTNIAAFVRSCGAAAVVVPTVIDKARFRPGSTQNDVPVIGWIGTHSTYPFLERLFPMFERLARDVRFRLLIVGSGRREIHVPGVDVDNRAWELAREVADLQSMDIGVYPMPDDEWSAGKSGLKAVQYMMSGVASVVSPVGACATLGAAGCTHITAVTDDEWLQALASLITDTDMRGRIGRAGREYAARHYAIDQQADALAAIITETAG